MKGLPGRAVLAAFILAFPAGRAAAKVTFTGYADLRYNADTHGRIYGSPASLADLGLSDGPFVSRGFVADAVGLFANTQLREDTDFYTDITFRNVGQTVGTLALQYAYAEYRPLPNTVLKAGKILLPFGYYNENRFYAFQRNNIFSPVFLSGILGLPIASIGVTGQQRVPLAPFTAEFSLYSVNGYGPAGTAGADKDKLRVPSEVGGLALSRSLRSTAGNQHPAVGGRVRLSEIGGAPVETGVSAYYGHWDASGLQPIFIGNTHVHAQAGRFDLLAEGLYIDVRGDQGFVDAVGDPDWRTAGFFADLAYRLADVKGKPLVAYAQTEYYRTRGRVFTALKEILKTWSGGLSFRAADGVLLKAEYLWLYYQLPYDKRAGFIGLTANTVQLSTVFTF